MLHHDQGIAQIPQPPQGIQQLVVIPLVQADGRLVQNIQHAHQTAADLGGQTNPLALAAGQGTGGPAEGQVAEAHRLQKPQPGADLLQDLCGDHLLVAGEVQSFKKGDLVVHRHSGGIMDGQPPYRDCQRLRPQPLAPAGRAGAGRHKGFDLLLAGIGLGLHIAALQIVGDALKGLMQHTLAPGLVVLQRQLFALGAVEDDVLHLMGQLGVGRSQGEMILFTEGVEIHSGDPVGANGVPSGGHHRAVQNGLALIGDHQRGVHLQLHAQTGTGGTGAEGAVEGEQPGRQLLNGHAAVLAGVVLGEGQIPLLPQQIHRHKAAGQIGGRLHAVGQAGDDIGPDDETVHHNVDLMLEVFRQLDVLVQLVQLSVHAGADIAGAAGVLQHLGVLALAAPHHRRHDLDPGALRQRHDLIDDLVDGLLADLLAALGAVGYAHPRPQKPQIVVDLRHRAHGGTGVLAGGFLVDGDGGRQTVDIVHIRLVHLAQKHPGVAGQTLHIPALSFGVNGVKGQRAFAAAGQPRQHHQLVPGNGHVDVLEVILPGALDKNFLLHGFLVPRFCVIYCR